MSNTFYHNITKGILNETDISDFMDSYESGDAVYKTESGNALLTEMSKSELRIIKHEHTGNTDTRKCNCNFPNFTINSPMQCENCGGI